MKNKFMVIVLLSCVSLFGCDDDTPKEYVPQQGYTQPSVVVQSDNGVGDFVAGAVVGSMLSGNNSRVVEHHHYNDTPRNANTQKDIYNKQSKSSSTRKVYTTPRKSTSSYSTPKRKTYTPFKSKTYRKR